jgi:hypothetical protein
VPFPEVYPMAPIPQGGYVNPPSAVLAALQSFDGLFYSLLAGLDSAWGDGNNTGLQDAINVMFLLQPAAQALFSFTLPDGSGVYGPDFVI